MDFLLSCPVPKISASCPRVNFSLPFRRRCYVVRSSLNLPFPQEKAKYYNELEAAANVVERACRLCVDVKASLFSSDGRILEKNDNTPVTIADFGVQALVSLEMSKLFPHIPLVAEEDSAFLRSSNLVDAVVEVVSDKATSEELATVDVFDAIDRGGRDACNFGSKPATYWVLDPIDGTRGFVKGSEALYVVGLALVVDGNIVLGVMGCPNWQESDPEVPNSENLALSKNSPASGVIMVSHIGCGTWRMNLWGITNITGGSSRKWLRCLVDDCQSVQKAHYCIPESQTWESLPLSAAFSATFDSEIVGNQHISLLSTCCGSLCKYLLVASGRASTFIQQSKTQTTIKTWDHAVGVICVHEAGGKVADWRGADLDFAADEVERRIIFPSGGILVSNESLHYQLLDIISCNSSAN